MHLWKESSWSFSVRRLWLCQTFVRHCEGASGQKGVEKGGYALYVLRIGLTEDLQTGTGRDLVGARTRCSSAGSDSSIARSRITRRRGRCRVLMMARMLLTRFKIRCRGEPANPELSHPSETLAF